MEDSFSTDHAGVEGGVVLRVWWDLSLRMIQARYTYCAFYFYYYYVTSISDHQAFRSWGLETPVLG